MGKANLTTPPTKNQLYSLHVVPMVFAIPSIIGSLYIMQHVLRSKTRRTKTLTRILLGMSSMDLIFSIVTSWGITFAPKDAYPFFSEYSVIGNWTTCNMTGFLLQGSRCTSVLYNGSLTLCYFLTIRNSWSHQSMKSIECYMHGIPFVIGWGTAIVALVLQLYNPTPATCTIEEYPQGCLVKGGCQRGEHAGTMHFILFYAWVWLVFVFMCFAMRGIYKSIERTERRVSRYDFRLSSSNLSSSAGAAGTSKEETKASMTSRFASQALLYCLAFGLTWTFGTVNAVVHENLVDTTYLPVIYLLITLEPLQGFWNAIIYIRPRYLSYRRKRISKKSTSITSSSRMSNSQGQGGGGGSSPGAVLSSSSSTTSTSAAGRPMDVFSAILSAVGVGEDGDDDLSDLNMNTTSSSTKPPTHSIEEDDKEREKENDDTDSCDPTHTVQNDDDRLEHDNTENKKEEEMEAK